jgi:hypothetical protein
MADIEASTAELIAALRKLGASAPSAPASTAPVEALAEAVMPWVLPEDLRWFWEHVDVLTLDLEVFPELIGPEWALRWWEPANGPVVWVAYQSWYCHGVELERPDRSAGGRLFEFSLDHGAYLPLAPCFADWIARIVGLLRTGAVERVDRPVRPLRLLDPHHEVGPRKPWVPVGGEAVLAEGEISTEDPDAWPPHWRL